MHLCEVDDDSSGIQQRFDGCIADPRNVLKGQTAGKPDHHVVALFIHSNYQRSAISADRIAGSVWWYVTQLRALG